MNRSEQINELATALSKVQAVIKPAVKDAKNPFFKSNYADLPAIWEACQKPLTDNGMAVAHILGFDAEGKWLETVLMHSSGQWISGRYPIKPVKDDPQGMGSATTYAKRYALAAMVGVVTMDEDDDAEGAQGRNKPVPKPPSDAGLPPAEDEDVTAGVRNWVDRQRAIIAECQTLPELTNWLDRNGGDLLKPALSSSLDKLMKKNNPAFLEVKNAYLQRMQKL